MGNIDIRQKNGGKDITIKTLNNYFTLIAGKSYIQIHSTQFGKVADLTDTLYLHSTNQYNLIDFNGRRYRGILIVWLKSPYQLLVINKLNIEDYLRSVLPGEMPVKDRSILEALKAQAIAARTYAYQNLNKSGIKGFDVYADVRDQVYKGADVEKFIADKAVRHTKDLVLSYKNQLAQCYYHSTSGGQTANIHQVWNHAPVPYLRSVRDFNSLNKPYCYRSKYSNWHVSWTLLELTAIIKKFLPSAKPNRLPAFTRVTNIQVEKRTQSGRVAKLKISTDRGAIIVSGDKTRWALRRPEPDYPILYSSWFKIEKFGKKLLISGKGFGHGIGMSQYGAMGRAKEGQSFIQILRAYYKKTQISRLKTESF